MWISYSDSEVRIFHPICEEALNECLLNLGKDREYIINHHDYTGTLEMDFVIRNRSTNKIFCVIEVKRTPADVQSSRYQFQAMSYIESAHQELERSYYILTNLEYALAFCYDARKPKPFQQILEPGLECIGSFSSDSEVEFKNKLVLYFQNLLSNLFQDNYNYSLTLNDFNHYMSSVKDDPKNWKSSLVVLLYEYIRGAFTYVRRNRDLKNINLFRNDIRSICEEAIQINFDGIFSYDATEFLSRIILDQNLVQDIYELGRNNVSGSSVADLLHEIVSEGHEHEGEVPTDLELARCVAILAKYYSDPLTENDYICDPAAGSGNLLSAAIDIFRVEPYQIKANDINKQLIELQSLRLGLEFVETIRRPNTPEISTKNITQLPNDYFDNIKAILLNPPFLAGINAVERKAELFTRIRVLTRENPVTKIGQMGLEAVFLELTNIMAQSDTVIAAIIPKTYLTARGPEAVRFRQFLLQKFNIQLLFTYPGKGIFGNVMMDTCVVVGRKDCNNENDVKVISSYIPIPDMNLQDFVRALHQPLNYEFMDLANGIMGCIVTREEAFQTATDGWRNFDSEILEATRFMYDFIENSSKFVQIGTLNYPTRRGNVGNSGASDLTFLNFDSEVIQNYTLLGGIVASGMRNATFDDFFVGDGDAEVIDFESSDIDAIRNIIFRYKQMLRRDSRQQRIEKTEEQLLNIVERDSSVIFPENSVLVPRATRVYGRVYLADKPLRVSTNFVVYLLPNEREAKLLASWMLTIFYQLNCEVSSKDQVGMRKMEIQDIDSTYVPLFADVTDQQYDEIQNAIINVSFLNLSNPEIRAIDLVWAEILFGSESLHLLNKAKGLLRYVSKKRANV